MNDNKVYMVRVQPDVYEQVKIFAKEGDRSINSTANLLLKRILTSKTLKEFHDGSTQIDKLRELVVTQGTNGTWNYDPYMQGMYNGMELMLAVLEDREPQYKKAPAEWLVDRSVSGEKLGTDLHPSTAARITEADVPLTPGLRYLAEEEVRTEPEETA
jgi:hypothetical protein